LEGKLGVRAHQTQEMKGKEGSGDPEGLEAKSGLASPGRRLDTSGEKGFFADAALRDASRLAFCTVGNPPSSVNSRSLVSVYQ